MGFNRKIDNLEEEGAEETTTEEETEEVEEAPEEAEISDEDTEAPAGEQDDVEYEEPEKFKNKSREDIIQSYNELEKTLGRRGENIRQAKDDIDKSTTKEQKDEILEDLAKELEDVDFDKMTPKEFAQMMIQKSDNLAKSRAQEIYRNATQVQDAVKTEISEAKEKYPMLEKSEEYRNLVLNIIEAGASKGEDVPLEDACEKVDALVQDKEKEKKEEKTKKKRKRTAVERQEPSGSEKESEEDKIKKGILSGGSSSESPLGGL